MDEEEIKAELLIDEDTISSDFDHQYSNLITDEYIKIELKEEMLQEEVNTLNTQKETVPSKNKIRYEEELNGETSNQSSDPVNIIGSKSVRSSRNRRKQKLRPRALSDLLEERGAKLGPSIEERGAKPGPSIENTDLRNVDPSQDDCDDEPQCLEYRSEMEIDALRSEEDAEEVNPTAQSSSSLSTRVKPRGTASNATKSLAPPIKYVENSLQSWLQERSDDEDERGDVEDIQLMPAHIERELDRHTRAWLEKEDLESDNAVNLMQKRSKDFLFFDWCGDSSTLKTTRETFAEHSGPTFSVTKTMSPFQVFSKFCDEEFFEFLSRQTNRNAAKLIDELLTKHSLLHFYKTVERDEMGIFIAILILQGLTPLSHEKDYWCDGYLAMPYLKNLMTYDRFILIKRLLLSTHVKNTDEDVKLRQIQPLVEVFKNKFNSLFLPGQEIVLDDSLLKWRGRSSFTQKFRNKAAKGIKSYELCDAATGYVWSFFMYKQTNRKTNNKKAETEKPPLVNATTKIVLELEPLFSRGHTIIMDSLSTSPLLARYIKSRGLDCYGTMRVNREFGPECFQFCSNMRIGEVVQSYCEDLHVMMWRDTSFVLMLSTFHKGTAAGREEHGQYKYKPSIVFDYNDAMTGVHKKDELLAAFPMEKLRSQSWQSKVFKRLLNVTLLNAYIIYRTQHNATQRCFRGQIAEDLIKMFKTPVLERPLKVEVENYTDLSINMRPVESNIGRLDKTRPILRGNHFVGTVASKWTVCVWCKKCRAKYICKQCGVTLCLQICFEEYHTVREPRVT